MSFEPYDAPPREYRRYAKEERGDPRYQDTRETYVHRVYPSSRDLVPRSRDSDLSVEEVQRDFPPPGYGRESRRRAADTGYYDNYDDEPRRSHGRDYDRDLDRRHRKGAGSAYYEEETSRRRVLSKQEQIIAAVAGAALALGGKEAFDRFESKKEGGSTVKRNPVASAAIAAAGGLAAYQGAEFYNKHSAKEEKKATYIVHRGRDGKVTEYYSDDSDDNSKEKKSHKNFLESALGAAGLGGAIKALTGGSDHDDKRDNRSRRGSSGSRSRSGSRERGGGKNDTVQKIQKAAMASLIAGATEAFRVRKEPGSWSGEKTKRILTAAAGAGAIDTAHDGEKHGKLGIMESVVGGLLGNRLIHGSKNNIEEDKKTGRSRSRSRARSTGGGSGAGGATGIAALTAGLGAALGAKKLVDGNRDRSQSRSRRRSADSYDSRDGSPDRSKRSRSRSVVGRSLAKLGIGSDPDERKASDRDRRRRDDSYDDSRSSRRGGGGRRNGSDDGYDSPARGGHGGRDRDRDREDSRYGDERSGKDGRRRDRSRRRSDAGSDTDLGDSDEDEKRGKKMRDRRHH